MVVLTLQTRVYSPEYSVLTLQTRVYYYPRVYYPDGSVNITKKSILHRWKLALTLPRWKY